MGSYGLGKHSTKRAMSLGVEVCVVVLFSRRNKNEMASLLLVSFTEQLEIWLSGKDYVLLIERTLGSVPSTHIVATTI